MKQSEEQRLKRNARTRKHKAKYKERYLTYAKNYYRKNKEKIQKRLASSDTTKIYNQKNKVKINKVKYDWALKNKDKVNQTSKKYREANKDKLRVYRRTYKKDKMLNDPCFKAKEKIRQIISNSIRNGGYLKKLKTKEILGCSFDEFKSHIESKFESWMNWSNYGLYNGKLNYGWDIDHKIGLKTANTYEDIIKLNHYTNLQPLCSYTNRHIKR